MLARGKDPPMQIQWQAYGLGTILVHGLDENKWQQQRDSVCNRLQIKCISLLVNFTALFKLLSSRKDSWRGFVQKG